MNYLRLAVYRFFTVFFLLSLLFLLTAFNASAADVTIAWDANSETDLDGYILFYGTASRNYTNNVDVGNKTQHTLTDMVDGTAYYFAVKAYDTSENKSGYSEELAYTLPLTNAAPNTPAKPAGPTSGFTQTGYAFDTYGTDADGDLLTYRFDWGDGSTSDWGGANARTHSYAAIGAYCIKAQSQDAHAATSRWSACLNINIVVKKYTISASANSNGSISPAGSVIIDYGTDQSFSINPNQNYHVADVVVDDASIGAIASYTFTNVVRNHTIVASFVRDNQPPVSKAGVDQTVRAFDTVQLDGSNSSDTDGDSLTFNWSFDSKPNGSHATLSDTKAVKPSFVVDVSGTYTVRLVVDDGTMNSAPDTISITAQNSPPVSRAGADQAVRVNDTVQLDGSGSSDVDGDSLTFKWSFVSRPAGSSAALSDDKAVKPTFDVDVSGSYTVQLIVNDGTVDGTSDTVTISTENSAPVSDAGLDQTVLVNGTVHLDGSGSSDVDGNSLTFKWSFVTKPSGSHAALSNTKAVKPTFDVDVAGTYTVQLIVNDSTLNSAPGTVTISTENSAPVSDAGSDQTVLVNDTAYLDGSGSSDVDGDSLTFKWSFVAKPSGSNALLSDTQAVKPTFDVDVAGIYTVQLIVNDGTANSAPESLTISTANSVPQAKAGADQAVRVNDTVQLDGSGAGDVDGDSLTYKWSFVAKPSSSNAALSDSQAVKPTFDVDLGGSYILQLIVNDGAVNSVPDTVTISTENSAPVSDAGTDQSAQVNDTVPLDGSVSSDMDGDALTFKWSFISKPGGSNTTLSDTNTVNPDLVVDVVGDYIVQLIVNDGTVNSAPDTVTISTNNSAPLSNAGHDQTVEEGDLVTLSGLNSTDPDDNIAGYSWKQTGGTSVTLSDSTGSGSTGSGSTGAERTFIAPTVTTASEMLTFQLTIQDTDGLQDVDTCVIEVTRVVMIDSDGDGVPDDQDAFPLDPDESYDTDGDGEGNQADTDDDNDGMPDTWELAYGLNPLKDDAAADPDRDEVSNINEYNLGSKPDHYEGNFKPDTPVILTPENSETVSLTPLLETGDFNDPNIYDRHSQTQWKIIRAFDNNCVFDVTSDVALTLMTMPKQILEEDTEYIWQVRFIDNHDLPSEWSEERGFITDFAVNDTDSNGVPDDQEVIDNLDLDKDGTTDHVQSDIKCVSLEEGTAQACVSIRDAENAVSIVSLEVEDPNDSQLNSHNKGKPNYFEFGMLDFKLLVSNPGDETIVTIYLSKPAYQHGNCFKYDPVNDVWLDYADYTEFSPNRKEVYLTLKDGGFGDADGIENGIIVDPLAFGSESDPKSDSSESPIDELFGGIIPNDLSCFISTTAGEIGNNKLDAIRLRHPALGLMLILVLSFLSYGLINLFSRLKKSANRSIQKQKPPARLPEDSLR